MTHAPSMTPRRRDASATRQALLKAARERFARVGYDSTTPARRGRRRRCQPGPDQALLRVFKATLAGSPQFLADAPADGDRAALVEALSCQLSADA